jgi:hypothetical protein
MDLADVGNVQYLFRKKGKFTKAVAYSSACYLFYEKYTFETLPIAVRDQTADMPDMTEKTPYICK